MNSINETCTAGDSKTMLASTAFSEKKTHHKDHMSHLKPHCQIIQISTAPCQITRAPDHDSIRLTVAKLLQHLTTNLAAKDRGDAFGMLGWRFSDHFQVWHLPLNTWPGRTAKRAQRCEPFFVKMMSKKMCKDSLITYTFFRTINLRIS